MLTTLSNRLKDVLEENISEVQEAFIAGRQILDLGLVANKVVKHYRVSGREGTIIKIDVLKSHMIVWSGSSWISF